MSRRRHRFGDRSKSDAKPVFQPKGYEDHKARHARRLEFNLQAQDKVKEWCKENNVTLQIKNNGHHWIFVREKGLVEWWPSSAKMVVGKKWNHGIHVVDYTQALHELAKVFPPLPPVVKEPEPVPQAPVPVVPVMKPSRWPRWIRWWWGG